MWGLFVLSSAEATQYITSALFTVYCCELVSSCHVSSKSIWLESKAVLCMLLVSKLLWEMLLSPEMLFVLSQGDGRESYIA